jgi:hypothetical protein
MPTSRVEQHPVNSVHRKVASAECNARFAGNPASNIN